MRRNSWKLQLAELLAANGQSVVMVFADGIPDEWKQLRARYPNLVKLDDSKAIAGCEGVVLE